MNDARSLIAALDLVPHPEGGWYRETWRAAEAAGERASGTAIFFLLDEGEQSNWHHVDATEIWMWHAGSPLTLQTAPNDDGPVNTEWLGPDVLAGACPQIVIQPGEWQSARADQGGWALVSCVVSPGFDFSGFTLAEPGWAPGA